ncbi:hypothetical protein PR202_gb28172 [Eleusine coracana subsp. coracana]|uniref:BPM/SPOP BACK domain-containing protein n=1 Tax=Eleusine coracana subsp. coracana TaxID=191504 RepID=A0AAV5FW30_ELECO|nr:hypothetical protein PR202_gb28172 [Eleusine coracana subsp. coracana]
MTRIDLATDASVAEASFTCRVLDQTGQFNLWSEKQIATSDKQGHAHDTTLIMYGFVHFHPDCDSIIVEYVITIQHQKGWRGSSASAKSSDISVCTAATALVLAEQHGCSKLKARCMEFIVANPTGIQAITATDGYKHKMESCPSLASELLVAAVKRGSVLQLECRSAAGSERYDNVVEDYVSSILPVGAIYIWT